MLVDVIEQDPVDDLLDRHGRHAGQDGAALAEIGVAEPADNRGGGRRALLVQRDRLGLVGPGMEAMRPGQLLRLTATDPGARADIPAWCRMTGHTLVTEEHPVYQIRRKEN